MAHGAQDSNLDRKDMHTTHYPATQLASSWSLRTECAAGVPIADARGTRHDTPGWSHRAP
jgi:hypothetical protein